MKSASNTILVAHPTVIIIADNFGFPSPLIILLNIIPNILNTDPNNIILIYAFA